MPLQYFFAPVVTAFARSGRRLTVVFMTFLPRSAASARIHWLRWSHRQSSGCAGRSSMLHSNPLIRGGEAHRAMHRNMDGCDICAIMQPSAAILSRAQPARMRGQVLTFSLISRKCALSPPTICDRTGSWPHAVRRSGPFQPRPACAAISRTRGMTLVP
jgi:hypothetical protein